MRRAAAALLLLLGCGSASGTHKLRIDVAELVSQYRRVTVVGTHLILVRIRNESEQPIEVESIRLDVATPDLELTDESLESFGRTLAPGETGEFNIYIAVSTSRSALSTAQTRIDSLRLTIGCRAADGNFIEGGTYPLSVEVLRG
jgi:hypothetical protein